MRNLLEKTLVVNELDIKKGLRTAAVAGLIAAAPAGLGYRKGVSQRPAEKPVATAAAEIPAKAEVSKDEYQVVRMRVTSYCPCTKCTGEDSPGVTASGHSIETNDAFVAADKRYSYGTEMVIPGYNDSQPVEVLDRGGAIQGDRIDVFFPTHEEALEWGVKNLDVEVEVPTETIEVEESRIDFPREDLDLAVWNKEGDTYTLKEEVKEKIFAFLKEYEGVDLLAAAKEIHIVGSITSNQYSDDADIDVHIIPKRAEEWNADNIKELQIWFNDHRDDFGGYVDEHPIEVYIQIKESQDLLSVGCYGILSDRWLVGPAVVPSDYDPYEDFADVASAVKDVVKDADVLFGELKRDVIDYEVIKSALQNMSKEDQEKLRQKLQNKLDEIEDNIELLYKERKGFVDIRRTMDTKKALKDISSMEQWKDDDATFKFINRYRYFKIIGDLNDLLSDEKVTPDEVDKIKSIMGV